MDDPLPKKKKNFFPKKTYFFDKLEILGKLSRSKMYQEKK